MAAKATLPRSTLAYPTLREPVKIDNTDMQSRGKVVPRLTGLYAPLGSMSGAKKIRKIVIARDRPASRTQPILVNICRPDDSQDESARHPEQGRAR